MPLYTYTCVTCDYTEVLPSKIDARDEQWCQKCGYRLIRSVDRPGLVWSPTRNGGHS